MKFRVGINVDCNCHSGFDTGFFARGEEEGEGGGGNINISILGQDIGICIVRFGLLGVCVMVF